MECQVLLRPGRMPEIISLIPPIIICNHRGAGLFIGDWVRSLRNCFTHMGKSIQAVSGFKMPKELEKELIIWPEIIKDRQVSSFEAVAMIQELEAVAM